MVRSHFRPIAIFRMLVYAFFCMNVLPILSPFVSILVNSRITDDEMPYSFIPHLLPFAFGCFFILLSLSLFKSAQTVAIDRYAGTIRVKHLLAWRGRTCHFTDMEGYFDGTEVMHSKSGTYEYRVIYLIKDRKVLKKISASNYSNFDEMKQSLSSLKYLGNMEDSFSLTIKMLFNKPVMNG